jgi:hypothetical protein
MKKRLSWFDRTNLTTAEARDLLIRLVRSIAEATDRIFPLQQSGDLTGATVENRRRACWRGWHTRVVRLLAHRDAVA